MQKHDVWIRFGLVLITTLALVVLGAKMLFPVDDVGASYWMVFGILASLTICAFWWWIERRYLKPRRRLDAFSCLAAVALPALLFWPVGVPICRLSLYVLKL